MTKQKDGATHVKKTDLPVPSKDGVVNGLGQDFPWSGFEDFSSFQDDSRFLPGVVYKTPSGMDFRVDHNNGDPNYPPDAHIVTEGGQQALAIQLGAVGRVTEVESNNINFQVADAQRFTLLMVGITMDCPFNGVFLLFHALMSDVADPGGPPKGFHWSHFSIQGESTYLGYAPSQSYSMLDFRVGVLAIDSAPISELAVKIKRVSWLYI